MKRHTAATLVTLLILLTTVAHADELVARRLISSQGCKGCHFFGGDGGALGPALDKVGARLKAFQIQQKLLNPKATNPDSLMPSFRHLKEQELKSLVDFLNKQK